MKKLLCALVLFSLVQIPLLAQFTYQPKEFIIKEKKYYIYPVRASNLLDVPPTGFTLPDGEYVIFKEYEFKANRWKKKMQLKDTTQISGLVTIKNNVANGKAELFDNYYYSKKDKSKQSGNYVNGMREGKWEYRYNEVLQRSISYHEGLKHGESIEYFSVGKPSERRVYKEGQMCDTVVYFHLNGKVSAAYDVFNSRVDTVRPPRNYMDFVFDEYRIMNKVSRLTRAKTFFKSYDRSGKLTQSIQFNVGRNPVFDTIKDGKYKFWVELNKADSTITVHETDMERYYSYSFFVENLPSKKYRKQKYYIEYKTDVYKNEEPLSKHTVRSTIDGVYRDTFYTIYTDRTKIIPGSWEEIVIGKRKSEYGFESEYRCIPALKYTYEVYKKNSHHKPVTVDSSSKRVNIRDTLGSSWRKGVRVAQEVRMHAADRDDYKWERFFTKKDLGFLKAVDNSETYYYFTNPGVKHYANNEFKPYSEEFSGSAWAITYLENNKPMSGKFIFSANEDIGKKNRFTAPFKYYSEAKTTVESGYLLNGVRNGRWERLKVNRKKHITENFDASFRYKPEGGEYYIVCDFKDGDQEGVVRSWSTDEKTKYENGKRVKKLYTYMDYEAYYTEGYLNGPYTTFHYTGKPKYTAHLNMGRLDGRAEHFDESGELKDFATWRQDTLNGPYGEFYEGHKTVEAFFESNKLQGKYTTYSQKNQKMLMEITAEKNRLTGKKLFFNEGNLKEEMVFADTSKFEFVRGSITYDGILDALKSVTLTGKSKMHALVKSYFENGKLLCEGNIVKGEPRGKWKFYNVAGTLINEANFEPVIFVVPGTTDTMTFEGSITGYFNNGKMRCKGYVINWESGYDCSTHQDKTRFTIFYTDTWNYDGLSQMVAGNGKGMIYDENGLKVEEGETKNHYRTGTWKFFDPNGKLQETGQFIKGVKEGVWYKGDLENLNFEDAACFDSNNPAAVKEFEYNKKNLSFEIRIYKQGLEIDKRTIRTNLNKEREYRKPYNYKHRRYIADF